MRRSDASDLGKAVSTVSAICAIAEAAFLSGWLQTM